MLVPFKYNTILQYFIYCSNSVVVIINQLEMYLYGRSCSCKMSIIQYLGITLDMNLNYNKRLENCIKTASYKCLMLSKVCRYITVEAAIVIYNTMILPHIDYGDALYDGLNSVLQKKLQTFQNRCLHICMCRNYYISVDDIHLLCRVKHLDVRQNKLLKLVMPKSKGRRQISLSVTTNKPQRMKHVGD